MGCNTSKETVPQTEAENSNETDNKEGEIDKKTDNKDEKSASAKTITLRSNGTAKSIEGTERDTDQDRTTSVDPEQAATKIQAAFRGHQTRKSMKQPGKQEETEPTQQQLEEEFRADDTELTNAATKIQASFRGHMIRKQMEKKDEDSSTSPTKPIQNVGEEELDIDLSDPDLNKAAVKIQASFRGHMVRKENEHLSEN